jgi:hypothetical protein
MQMHNDVVKLYEYREPVRVCDELFAEHPVYVYICIYINDDDLY